MAYYRELYAEDRESKIDSLKALRPKFKTRSGKFGAFFADLFEELNHTHIGQCFHFTGTVKSHSFNDYSKQNETMFNRVKIEKVFEKVEEELDI